MPWITVAVAATGLVLCCWLFPVYGTYFPKCLFHVYTGLHCPGCGTQRAVVALVQGDIMTALQYNLPAVTALLGMTGYLPVAIIRGNTGKRQLPALFYRRGVIKIIVLILMLFAVLRNIPARPFVWLAPPG